jgi:carbonic anhydrase
MLSRRDLMRGAAALGVALAVKGTAVGAEPEAAAVIPEDALARLSAGQARFAAGQPEAPQRDLARLREVAPKQKPFASILGCADSRVPIELLYDQGFGNLFVVRVAGNVAASTEIASLEYATRILGTSALIVLGHSDCGAVKAALEGGEVPGQISTLYQHIVPALNRKTMNLEQAVAANVAYQARQLRKSSTVIRALVKEGRLAVVGGVFDLNTGAVRPVEI